MNKQIPAQSSFDFNEICSLTEVKPYVLRFWESEFSQIDPVKSDNGQKVYDLTDLYAIFKVKELLFDQKLSIQQAKHKFMEGIEIEVPAMKTVRPSEEFVQSETQEAVSTDFSQEEINDSEQIQLESALELEQNESDAFNQQVDQLINQYGLADVRENLFEIKDEISAIKLKQGWQ